MRRGAYGNRLGKTFRMQQPPTLVSSVHPRWRLAVTEMRYESPDFGFTDPVVPEDAFLLSLELHGLRQMETWLDGKPVSRRPVLPGGTNFFDLSRNPVAHMVDPFHALLFYLPRAALSELVTELGMAPGELRYRPGIQAMDPVIEHLGHALSGPLHAGQSTHALFIDQVLLALRSHLVLHYHDGRRRRQLACHGLADWQEKRAKELMRAHVVAGISLWELACACNLSESAFLHGFRKRTGITPHQWLMMLRAEQAMRLMRESDKPLAAIARDAGFADQSHFTRTFTMHTGVTPGEWRRSLPRKR
jgi:AraC-like DNA-binding protein